MKPSPQGSAAARSTLVLFFKIALAGVLLWWLVESGRLDFSQLRRANFGAAFWGMVFCQCAMLACIAARWHFLTRACGLHFSWPQTVRIGLIGNFAAVWTPAGLGLDGARLWQARKIAPQQMTAVTASTVLDRLVGLWTLLALCVPACVLLASRVLPLRAPMLVLAGLCLVGFIAPFLFRAAMKKLIAARWPDANGVLAALAHPNFRYAFCLGLSTHSCNALSLWCALQTLNESARAVEFWPVLMAAPPVILSSALPLTPLGLGVTDLAASTLLQAVNIIHGAEATMLGRAVFVAISALCGLAWLWPFGPHPVRAEQRADRVRAKLQHE